MHRIYFPLYLKNLNISIANICSKLSDSVFNRSFILQFQFKWCSNVWEGVDWLSLIAEGVLFMGYANAENKTQKRDGKQIGGITCKRTQRVMYLFYNRINTWYQRDIMMKEAAKAESTSARRTVLCWMSLTWDNILELPAGYDRFEIPIVKHMTNSRDGPADNTDNFIKAMCWQLNCITMFP